MKEDIPKPKAEIEFPPERVAFYEARAQKILDHNSREFYEFIAGHETLSKEGDKILCLEEGTGYNIILSEGDMPLASRKNLIFYNNYVSSITSGIEI